MSAHPFLLPGIEGIRTRFLERLVESHLIIEACATGAQQEVGTAEVHEHLHQASEILHKISGSGAPLGFVQLGDKARRCEHAIVAYIHNPSEKRPEVLDDIVRDLFDFVAYCRAELKD